jgi:epoxyqueuosine reductase
VIPAGSAKQLIRERAWDLGIDGLGFCDGEPLRETREAYEAAIQAGLIPEDSAPHPSTVVRLTTPGKHLSKARSILSAFQYYHEAEEEPLDASRAEIAPYTRSDYYLDLKVKLMKLAGFMAREFGCRTKVFSCYVTLAEKPLAAKAGTGFYGKHGVIISPGHGSYIVLGEIITDMALHPDGPLQLGCGDCTRCIEACPTGAIVAPYLLDRNRCIQHLSERRGIIPHEIREVWSNRLYGCTTCQDVCPYNQGLRPTSRKVIFGRVGSSVPLRAMLDMDAAGFQAKFLNNQIGMREPNAIKRNAIIAAGNSGLDSLLPPLRALTEDPDPMIRLHSLWAVARLAGSRARTLLQKALRSETEPQVLDEIKSLLDGFGGFR